MTEATGTEATEVTGTETTEVTAANGATGLTEDERKWRSTGCPAIAGPTTGRSNL